MVAQIADVGLAAQEPQQFVDDRAQVHLLGRQQGEPGRQVEAHLIAKNAERADARTILLTNAVVENVLHQVEILSHGVLPLQCGAEYSTTAIR